MTAARYPKYSPSSHRAKPGCLCVVCGRIAGRAVTIQLDFFRDNDEGPFDVCRSMAHPPQEVLDAGLRNAQAKGSST